MVEENKKSKKKIEDKKAEVKTEAKKASENKASKEDEKITELRIELLKAGAKRQRIKREIARLLTLQNTKMKESKK